MQPLNVVLLQSDSRVAQSLVSALAKTFGSVHEVQSLDEQRTSIAKHRAGVAILASLSDVQRLSREFPKACIVCTHRLADEDMWTAALSAGAADVCPPSDTRGILRTALRNAPRAQSAAA